MPNAKSDMDMFLQLIKDNIRAHKRQMADKYCFDFDKETPIARKSANHIVWSKVMNK